MTGISMVTCLETKLNQLKLDDVSFIPKQQQLRNTSCVKDRRVSWADMPADILFLIFGLLRDINDHNFLDLYQCLAVCRTWRSVAKQIWRNHILPTTPWLLHEEETGDKIFFNTNPFKWHKNLRLDTNDEESSYSFDFNSYSMKIYASYDGWLLVGTSLYQPLLYNPVTKLLIQLPPLPIHYLQLNFHMKFVSSGSRPTDPNCIICLRFCRKREFINFHGTFLVFCRPASSTSWLILEENVEDIIFCGGQFYAIAASGALFVYNDDIIYGNIDPYTSWSWKKMKIGGEICGLKPRSVNDNRFFFYLVESKTGEILMIKRIFEWNSYTTKSFCIFKLKYRGDTIYGHDNYYYWEEISGLSGKEALLLGWNDCISLSLDEHTAYKSNCIYFYDEDTWGKVMAYGMYDFKRHSILKKSEESDLYYCRFFNPSKPSNL